jgi:hypothetical protein
MNNENNRKLSSLKLAVEKLQHKEKLELDEKFFNKSSLINIKYLFTHLLSGKIKLCHSKNNTTLTIEASQNPIILSPFTLFLSKGILLFNFYLENSINKNFKDFKKLFFGERVTNPLLQFIIDHNICNLEIKILLHTIKHQLKNNYPLFLSDIELNASEHFKVVQIFLEQEGKLIQQGLIHVKIENGITICMTLTKRCILLINEQSIPSLEKFNRKNYELYSLHYSENITNINLFYNDLNLKLFQSLEEIIASNKHNSIALTTLLYGPSGTGKTEFVYQLAKKTNAIIMYVDYSKIISKWIGESEKNLSQLFSTYETLTKTSNRPTIILLNEADALINKRVMVQQSNDVFANQIQAQLLEILENFKGILIATTNIEKNMDKAFERRFLFKSKIDYPTLKVKEKLIKNSKFKDLISNRLINKLIKSNWSPAQFANYELKIQLLTEIKKLNEKEIEELLIEEGLITVNSQIGY